MIKVVFLLFPALELFLLVKAGTAIGAFNMVLWVFVSAAIGLWAVQTQGRSAVLRVQADLAKGAVPQNPFMEGLLLFLGGFLLILPGVISDAIGLLLLIPLVRYACAIALARYLSRYLARKQAQGQASKIVFFHSDDFSDEPGLSGAGRYGAAPLKPFHPDDRDRGTPENPRQATIIESTVIEVKRDDETGGATENRDNRHRR